VKRLAWPCVAALLAFAGACAPQRSPKAPEELVFWQFAPAPALESAARAFEAANPGWRVRVEQRPSAGLADSLEAALASGSAPDLCEVEGRDMPALLASGALVDWSAGVADQRDSLLGWELCRVGDALYGLPWRLSARVLFVNTGLLARAGLDSARAPATWDELVSAAARVERLGHGVHGFGIALDDSGGSFPDFMSLAWSNGGEVLSAGLDSSRFESRANEEALGLLLKLRRAALVAREDSLEGEFARGRLALRLASAREASRLAREAPSLRFRIAAVPAPPARRDSVAPYGEGEVLVSFTRSRHKEQALRLARFLACAERSVPIAALEGDGVPSLAGADTLAWFAAHPREALAAREAGRARFAPGHPAWNDMERAIEQELGQALRGAKDPRRAVIDAAARVAALVQRRAAEGPPAGEAHANGGEAR
jgi:multiple sugar transport system substrate-binding protein